ncbi:MAG TPA: flagellar biosynthesis protein FlhF [Gallionellaceae bacterium]|nr:flagellar biosynthesis protein FlhF [Gallionellaceae bacterium]
MNVKKFTAATTRDALRMVRDEFGDEAVILSNRKVAAGIEIMAMTNDALSDMTQIHMQSESAQSGLSRPSMQQIPQLNERAEINIKSPQFRQPVFSARQSEIANKQNVISEKQALPGKAAPARPAEPGKLAAPVSADHSNLVHEIKSMRSMLQEQFACMTWSDMQQRDPKRTRLLRNLVNAGFSPSLARQLLDKMPTDADMSWVNQVLAHNLHVATQAEDVVVRGGIYALIGPTGVGKTTTTAKLAARAVVRYGADSVALVTTDGYRIGAHEQLRIYGKILGVSVHAARDTGDLRVTLSGLKHKRLVLIDTMGMGQRDKRVAEQAEMFDAAGVQRLLLLNSTSSGETLEDVVRMYHGHGVIGCIATKLDEAATLGSVLDVMVRHKLALHYVSNGQRVPEDFHEVNMAYLLHRAFGSANKSAAFAAQELDIPALMAGQAVKVSMRGEHAV